MTDRRLGTLIGQYHIESLLGQGGMAAVYQAEDTRTSRRVAIKLMHSHLAAQTSFRNAFMQEATVFARLSHPNIVRVLSFETLGDELVLAMELATGGNLRQYIKSMAEKSEPILLTHAVDIIVQLSNAIHYAHQQGTTHRDMKPDNVVLQPFTTGKGLFPYRPLITDFGLARLSSADEFAITGQPLGTYAYMSPEQTLAEKIDARTDIYSLGIMLYELSVGQLPFKPQSIAEAARYHGREVVPAPSAMLADFPPELEKVILKALQKSPEDRYATASDMGKALLSLRGGLVKANTLDRTSILDANTEMRLNRPSESSSSVIEGKTLDILPVPSEPIIPATDSPAMPAPPPITEQLPAAELPESSVSAHTPPMVYPSVPSVPDSRTESRRKAPGLFDAKTDSYKASDIRKATLPQVQAARTVLGDDNTLSRVLPPPAPIVLVSPEPAVRPVLSIEDKTPPPVDDAMDIPLPTEWTPPVTNLPVAAASRSTPNPQVDQLNTERQKQPLPAQVPRMLKLGKNLPPSTRGDYLVCMNVLRHTFVFALDNDLYHIGTASDQDIILEAQYLSRRHAIIQRHADGFVVVDSGSSNGTWLNDSQLQANKAYRWNYGDIFRLGDYWITILPVEVGATATDDSGSVQNRRTPVPARKSADSALVANGSSQPVALDRSSANAGAVAVAPPSVSSPIVKAMPAPSAAPVTPAAPIRANTPARAASAPPVKGFDAALDRTIINMEEAPQTLVEDETAPEVASDKGLEGKVLHNYRLDKFMGQGSIASVYAGTDLRLNRPIAVKVLHESLASQLPFRKGFLEQARLASTLEHPNVVRVLTFDQTDEYVYMVMELVTGGSLRQYIRKLRREDRVLPYLQVVEMGRQLADGLHYVHQQGLLHRDIKPDNIVLRDANASVLQPVLTDFGLAQVSANAVGETFITDQPTVMFPYMSPEAVVGARQDTRSDVYEVGIILYELTVGQVPFQPRSIGEAIRMHTREPVVRPTELRADIPRELERVIMRCLEKDPNSRYQTAIELSRMLEALSKTIERREQSELAPVVEDPLKTTIMSAPIAVQMPYFTPQPVTDEQVGYDRLILYSEKYPSRALRVDRDILTIGRDSAAGIALEGNSVSRRHARIERFGTSYRLIDLSSRNGTWLGLNRLLPNVAEVWEATRTARIGDYWLRIEPNVQMARAVNRQQLAYTNLGDADDSGRDYRDYQEQPPQRQAAMVLPAPAHDRVGLTVLTPVVTVTPGQSIALSMEIHNLSNLVDHFIISVHGLPNPWYTIHAEPIYLLPNNRETASITLHPPLASTSSAGAHAFEISVTARAQSIKSIYQQCSLNIVPFYNFRIDLQPKRVRAGGRAEVEITNTGNTYDTYTVQARDREMAIKFNTDGKQFTIPPGQTDFVSLRLMGRSRPFIGVQSYLPFEVSASSVQPTVPPQTQMGELVVKPFFPAWIISFLMIMLIFCGILTLLLYTTYNNNLIANQTATVVAIATSLPPTATAYALLDLDGDNLANVKEAELGTDPLLPDTDTDKLDDGAEVRVWGTDPLNADTDGDTLSDGDEVYTYGTDPRKLDTDGDGIPDNEDIAPLLPPTATPSPFPTLFGSNGEICPGSPPTRLAVGIPGRVDIGGVNNRLRDNPGAAEGAVIALLPPGTEFQIIGGPTCDTTDFIRWWQVDVKGQQGWTAEGVGEEYYLSPKNAPADGSAAAAGGSASPEVVAATDSVLASLPPLNPSGLDRQRVGFQLSEATNDMRWPMALALVGDTRVGWVKVQVNWSELQPNSATDLSPAFQSLLVNLRAARERGLKILVTVVKAPAWTRALAYSRSGPPDNPDTYALFLTLLLQQANGTIDAIEVWNEPNLAIEWTGNLPFSGVGYMALFEPAYNAIRAISSDIIIVSAGLAPTISTDSSVDDRRFLRQMLGAGLAGYRDIVIGVHPYSWANAPDIRCCTVVEGRGWNDNKRFYFLDNLEVTRTILSDANAALPLWITEFGYATWEGLPGQPPEAWYAYLNPDEQAAFLLRAVQVAQSLDYVQMIFLWNLNFATDTEITTSNPFAAFSLVLRDSERRPAFNQLVQS